MLINIEIIKYWYTIQHTRQGVSLVKENIEDSFLKLFLRLRGAFPLCPEIFQYTVTLPVLRNFHCERCRIRTRDHTDLSSLERYNYVKTIINRGIQLPVAQIVLPPPPHFYQQYPVKRCLVISHIFL